VTNELVFTSLKTPPASPVTIPLVENVNFKALNAATQSESYDTGLFIMSFYGKNTSLTVGDWTVQLKTTLKLLSKQDIDLYTAICQETVALST
jgi:hypothetical protein